MTFAELAEPSDAIEVAAAAGLVYVTNLSRGWRRKRVTGGFAYVDDVGQPICDETQLARIRRLAIPPAYHDVWICADHRGHVQATGRDARGRKQYRYHAQWHVVRDDAKFERMVAFGAALPALRRRLRKDLAQVRFTRTKVLAAVVCLLDATRARVGNDEYARDNGSFGLTTLRNRHVEFGQRGKLRLRFRGKGGVGHEIDVDDAQLARIVHRCHQLPGQRLFQYVDDDGEVRPVDSGQVNDYLRDLAGADFTAKDFRTWSATVRAVELLAATPIASDLGEREAKTAILDVVRRVAEDLRNTPAVCRKSYINPAVFDAWRGGLFAKARSRNIESRTLAILGAAAHTDAPRLRRSRRPRER